MIIVLPTDISQEGDWYIRLGSVYLLNVVEATLQIVAFCTSSPNIPSGVRP